MPIDPAWLAELPEHLRPWAQWASPWIVRYAPEAAKALVKVFRDRFQHDSPETQRKALANEIDAVTEFTSKVDALLQSGRITEVEVRARFDEPDFAKTLQDRLLEASETPNQFLHEELAVLMAEMLTTSVESRRAIILRHAAASLKQINARQARTLGLAYALLHMIPTPDIDPNRITMEGVTEYVENEIAPMLAAFGDTKYDFIDIDYFAEIGLVNILDRHFETSPSPLLAKVSIAEQRIGIAIEHPAYLLAQRLMHDARFAPNARPFEYISLTPIGFIVGRSAYNVVHNETFNLTDIWDDPAGDDNVAMSGHPMPHEEP